MGKTTKGSMRSKMAQLRKLACDPVAREILKSEGSVFEEHGIPLEETILPDVPDELKTASKHILALSSLSAPGLPVYSLTGALQRFQSFVTINLAIAGRMPLLFEMTPFQVDSWAEFAEENDVPDDETTRTSRELRDGADLADKVLSIYRHSAHRLAPEESKMSDREIVTLVGIHIHSLCHLLLDQMIAIGQHHADMHAAQEYFQQIQAANTAKAKEPPVSESQDSVPKEAEWPSYI